jgi:CheY-like chemotaxis protein
MSKILLVDDEPDIVYLIKKILEKNGHDVLVAYNGEGALEKSKQEKPNLIILDIMMAEPDGWEVSRTLKLGEETKDIPIVMLTVRTSNDSVEKSLMYAHADAHIGKPASGEEILGTINSILSTQRGVHN